MGEAVGRQTYLHGIVCGLWQWGSHGLCVWEGSSRCTHQACEGEAAGGRMGYVIGSLHFVDIFDRADTGTLYFYFCDALHYYLSIAGLYFLLESSDHCYSC